MTIVTKDPRMEFVAVDKKGRKQIVYNNETYMHNYPFTFEIPFSDQPVPQSCTATFYNMTKKHKDFYRKGMHCWINFSWGSTPKKIVEGYISSIAKASNDGTTDSKSITFTEGTNYNNVKARKLRLKKHKEVNHYKSIKVTEKGHFEEKRVSVPSVEVYKEGPKKGQKHVVHHWKKKKVWVKPKTKTKRVKTRATKTYFVNRTYRKGTTYRKVIEGIAGQAQIKIDKIELAKNGSLKKPYTAKGKPLTLLKYWATKCQSKMTYERGKLVIINPKASKRTWFVVDDKDLIQIPAENEANEANEGDATWEIVIPLVPDITTNTGIIMNSKFLKGKYYVKAGQHSFDGESAQTQCTLVKI